MKPSQVERTYWIYAEREPNASEYPDNTPRSGKWLIFRTRAEVDAVWERVKDATKHGLLGPAAKVATAKPNPLGRPGRHVVCVYTYDWRDEADVLRVREVLRRLGITETI
jgi:hypothetical protein